MANTLHVVVAFTDLLGTTTASHIHTPTPAPGTGTAGVATTTPSFPGFPLGVTSGTYDDVLDLMLASSYNPSFVTANGGTVASAEAALAAGILAGEAYLNIHTTVVPGGEIRGFLTPALGASQSRPPRFSAPRFRHRAASQAGSLNPGFCGRSLRACSKRMVVLTLASGVRLPHRRIEQRRSLHRWVLIPTRWERRNTSGGRRT